MGEEGVTIDIGKHPRSKEVQSDDKGYFYNSNSGKVLLTDDWYPDLEGTYRKFTHTPEDGCTIGDINKGGASQTGLTGLATYSSVSVFYWAQDHSCSKPLLIQLGDEEKYYEHDGSDNNWSEDGEINANNLKQKLDKQNCTRNKAHIVNITDKNVNKSYQCPSCNRASIRVYNGSGYYGHNPSSSITGFKNASTYQLGLPPVKGVHPVKVYWDNSGGKPIVIAQQTDSGTKYFRRNTENENAWIAVSDKAPPKETLSTPQIPLDLSNTSGKPYTVGSTKVIVAVLDSSIGDGYWKHEHSLRGSLFKVGSFMHKDTPLNDIQSPDKLLSITAYYYGESPTVDKLLLVELRSSGSSKYTYFYRRTKDESTWTEYSVPGGGTGQLVGNGLKTKLEELREKYGFEPPSPPGPPKPQIPPPQQQPESKPTSSPPTGSSSSQTKNTEHGNSDHGNHRHDGSHGIHKTEEVSKTSTSLKHSSTSSGIIAAGVIGGILCILILTLFIKRVGPSVKTYMASRRRPL